MKGITRRFAAAALAAAMALTLSPAALGAAGTDVPKEEVVYINLDAAGAPETVDVVNIFDLERPGRIVDHGNYVSVRNMTTTDALTLDGGTVTVDAKAGRLYYEGRLPDAQMPWEIGLRYFLDGRELSAAEAAGASGELEIRMTVRENPRSEGDFFDSYALQASFTLDGDRFADISAEGATAANVGGDKQLTYTILPGRGADISIKARVTDFAMDPVAINGVPLSLDVEVDDEALLGKISELMEAVQTLDDGAGELSGGVEALQEGVDSTLLSGAEQLAGGAADLQSGAGALQSGVSSVNSGASGVSAGASQVNAGVQEMNTGLGQLDAGLAQLDDQSAALRDGSAAVLTALQTMQTGLAEGGVSDEDIAGIQTTLSDLGTQLTSLTTTLSGMSGISDTLGEIYSAYAGASATLKGIIDREPDEGLKGELEAVKGTMDNATLSYLNVLLKLAPLSSLDPDALQTQLTSANDYVTKLTDMTGNLETLKSGVDTLVAQYETLDEGIQAYTQGVTDARAGADELLTGGAALAEGSASLETGASALSSGTSQLLGGVNDLSSGAAALSQGASALSGGAAALSQGVGELESGAAELAKGTAAMRDQTDGMDEKVEEQIDALMAGVTGGDGELVSFVSPENRSVRAVQFVIRTPAIQKNAEPSPTPAPEEETTFWEKLTALF